MANRQRGQPKKFKKEVFSDLVLKYFKELWSKQDAGESDELFIKWIVPFLLGGAVTFSGTMLIKIKAISCHHFFTATTEKFGCQKIFTLALVLAGAFRFFSIISATLLNSSSEIMRGIPSGIFLPLYV